MIEKAIVDIYFTYGKGDGAELSERFVINNTTEEREEIFDNFSYDDSYDSKKDFINGGRDVFQFSKYGGDWDEPTGGYVEINTKSELISAAKKKVQDEIEDIEKLFK